MPTVGHVLGLVEEERPGENRHEAAHLGDDLGRVLPVPVLKKDHNGGNASGFRIPWTD